MTLLFVGGSHAARLAELDENRAAPICSFRRRGCRSGNTAVEAIAAYLHEVNGGFVQDTVVVLPETIRQRLILRSEL